MNTFHNAIMALQNRENGTCVYHLPLYSPQTKKFLSDTDFRCCNGTSIEAFTHLNSNIYFFNNSNIWINLFIPSEVNWKTRGVSISQSRNFPADPNVHFVVSNSKPSRFAMNLFMPSWATEQTKVLINGELLSINISPLSYLIIDRDWKNGDEIDLIFDYKLYTKAMPDNQNIIAFYYGPVILAFKTNKELILKGDSNSILKSVSKDTDNMLFTLNNDNIEYILLPFYKITNTSYGVYVGLTNEE